jgi:hypothetical protein
MDFGAVAVDERLDLPHATVLCIASGSMAPNGLVAAPLNEPRAGLGLPPDPRSIWMPARCGRRESPPPARAESR